jgi:hypothetical protein
MTRTYYHIRELYDTPPLADGVVLWLSMDDAVQAARARLERDLSIDAHLGTVTVTVRAYNRVDGLQDWRVDGVFRPTKGVIRKHTLLVKALSVEVRGKHD